MADDDYKQSGFTCCEPAKWKREEIPDHKFDYIDVDDFTEDNWVRKFKYSFVFLVTLKSILVYMADVIIVALLFANGSFACDSNSQSNNNAAIGTTIVNCNSNTTTISSQILPLKVRPWLILVTVFLSFVLLIIDWRKAQSIIRSKDISYAFTSPIAYRYYCLRSYPHYCFFSQIQNSRKTVDVLAFFVFFMFKGWKRLLLAEFPRQLLNALNLYDVIVLYVDPNSKQSFVEKYYDAVKRLVKNTNSIVNVSAYALSSFTVLMWLISFLSLLAAFFIYIPLLCKIRGNLKEYCCHKIDKRIGELLRKKSRKRTEEARKAELAEIERNNILRARARQGGYTSADVESLNESDGGYNKAAPPLGMTERPTLPDIDVDLDAPPVQPVSNAPYGYAAFAQPPPRHPALQSSYGGSRYGGSEYGDDSRGPSEFGTLRSSDGGRTPVTANSSGAPMLPPPPPPGMMLPPLGMPLGAPLGAFPPPPMHQQQRGSPAPGSPVLRPLGAGGPLPPPPPPGMGGPLPPPPGMYGLPPPPGWIPPPAQGTGGAPANIEAWLRSQTPPPGGPSSSVAATSGSAYGGPRSNSPGPGYRGAPSRPMMQVQQSQRGPPSGYAGSDAGSDAGYDYRRR